MPSRSSRSRPASRISRRELTGSASRTAMGPSVTRAPGSLVDHDCEELAQGGAAQDARRLGGGPPGLRLRGALRRLGGGGAPGDLPAVRGRAALALPGVRRPVLVGVRRRMRGLRRRAAAAGGARDSDPEALSRYAAGLAAGAASGAGARTKRRATPAATA